MKKTIILLAAVAALFSACKKDPKETTPTTPASTTGTLEVRFEHMLDTLDIGLDTVNYVNANNDTFTVSKIEYFISNIKLTKSDGTIFTEPNSYHLVNEATETSKIISIANVPYGTYTAISFMIGVDSVRNVSGAQTGALDPATGMFWSWSSGYIMAKFEGTSPQSPATNHSLLFHVGGFSGANNVLKTVSPSFGGATATVSSSIVPQIHLKADLQEWFKSPTSISFATLNTIHMPGASAKLIADNYADMFSVEHIHN